VLKFKNKFGSLRVKMQTFGVEYNVNERRLFTDSSKRSLKAALLHNGNNCTSMPIGHSAHLKESYENLELVLTKIGHSAHDWMIYGVLKMLRMLLDQHAGCTKCTCFMYEWDSTARSQHWEHIHWTPRTSPEPGSKNILRKGPFDPKELLLSTLHIQLGIMKQSVKYLPNTGNCFKHLCKNIPHLSEAKLNRMRFRWS
jgi:hypothetical protein